jgi:hypothetical protein
MMKIGGVVFAAVCIIASSAAFAQSSRDAAVLVTPDNLSAPRATCTSARPSRWLEELGNSIIVASQ